MAIWLSAMSSHVRQEREVKTFLKQNQELLSLFGARDDSFSSTARPMDQAFHVVFV